MLAAAHDDVNDRLPEVICLWYWKARKAPLDDLRGIILENVMTANRENKERRGEERRRGKRRGEKMKWRGNNLICLEAEKYSE